MARDDSVRTDIVLIGGGHAHVHVLAALARRPLAGVRMTLVAREVVTPYSGMLPGLLMGFYTHAQMHIDLAPLAAATGTRLVHAEAVGLDRAGKRVVLADGGSLRYGVASIDVGISPELASLRNADRHGIPVKPIGAFLRRFDDLRMHCRAADGPRRIIVIGGGAGGTELLLAVRARLLAEAAASARAAFRFALVTADEIMPTHNTRVRAAFRRMFGERSIALHERCRVVALESQAVVLADGERIAADAVMVTTQAAAPHWFRDTGLALDDKGFLAVRPTLQVHNDPDVFAAGDCAALIASPREKAGVFAVRAGPPLADNLRRRVLGEAPRPWRPQSRHLALISTGERSALASYGPLMAEGAWVWTLKDVIDRAWMRRYQDLSRFRKSP